MAGFGCRPSKKINEVQTPRSQGQVERNVTPELKLVAVAQQEKRERVPPALKRDLSCGLRSCAFADGGRHKLKWLAFGDPALDVVQTPLAAHLMESAEVLREPGKLTLPIWLLAFRHGAAILIRAHTSPPASLRPSVSTGIWRGSAIPGMC
jgi:hypothetical protein